MPRLRRSLLTENQNRICGVYFLLDHPAAVDAWPRPSWYSTTRNDSLVHREIKRTDSLASSISLRLYYQCNALKKPALADASFSLHGGRQLQGREVESMLIFKIMLTRIEARFSSSCCLLCDVIKFSLEPIRGQLFPNGGIVIESFSFSERASCCQSIVNGIRLSSTEP